MKAAFQSPASSRTLPALTCDAKPSARVSFEPLTVSARTENQKSLVPRNVFQSPHPKHQGDRYKETNRGFSKACELADVQNFRFHDLRHTFGTCLAEKGVPIHQIAELMGHADIRTTMKYVHAATSSKKLAVDLLVEEAGGETVSAEKKWLKNGSN